MCGNPGRVQVRRVRVDRSGCFLPGWLGPTGRAQRALTSGRSCSMSSTFWLNRQSCCEWRRRQSFREFRCYGSSQAVRGLQASHLASATSFWPSPVLAILWLCLAKGSGPETEGPQGCTQEAGCTPRDRTKEGLMGFPAWC